MLTGRTVNAIDGERLGFAQYLVGDGEGVSHALALANRIATNPPLSNYAITQALPRIADLPAADGLFVESLMSSIAQGDEAAKKRVRAFLDGKAEKVKRG
jgi:(methylthio)acryloyl-CoA hydratase